MAEAYMINVGFHSNLGTPGQSENSKSPLIFEIVDKFPFNPTYDPLKFITNFHPTAFRQE